MELRGWIFCGALAEVDVILKVLALGTTRCDTYHVLRIALGHTLDLPRYLQM